MNREMLFTGYYSFTGDKIYLGDKLKQFIDRDLAIAFVLQYDLSENEYCLIPYGKDVRQLPYQKYPVKGNLDSKHAKFHVVGNVIFPESPKIGDLVKITVGNKGENFSFGTLVEVIRVEAWKIEVRCTNTGEEKTISAGEFMEIRS